ncbi:MAG: hypothetical protein WC947_03380 [Elusimicrobiota bacterium]
MKKNIKSVILLFSILYSLFSALYAGLSISLTTGTWNIGNIQINGSTFTTGSYFGVLNNSDWYEDITLKVSSTSVYTPAAAPAADKFTMSYFIGSSTVTLSTNTVVMKSGLMWNTTQYFGLKFDAPASVTTGYNQQQAVVVTVAAQAEVPTPWENRTLPSGSPHYSSIIVWVPEFTASWGSTAGGFWVDKYESSQPDATTTSMGSIGQNVDPGTTPAVSVYNKVSWGWITSINARKAAMNRGSGFHLISSLEWAAITDTATVSMIPNGGPGGNNANVTAPGDQDADTAGTQYGVSDATVRATWPQCDLTGTEKAGSGGYLWSIPQNSSGVCDMNGNLWEFNSGIHIKDSIAYLMIATVPVSAQCGNGTGSLNTLTDSSKNWTTNQWNGFYLYDSAGTFFQITGNAATTLTVSGTPASGFYEILLNTGYNICSGMTSGNRTLTLRTEPTLKVHKVPATSDATGSVTYGYDGYWFTTTGSFIAFRGGGWNNGPGSGVFALYFLWTTADYNTTVGLRAACQR